MKEVIQRGFEQNPNPFPKNWQLMLKIGKVIKVNQAQKTVDVVLMDGSGSYQNVPVLTSMATTASGTSHLPQMFIPEDGDDAPVAYFRRDIYAVLGFIEGVGTLPVVLGFKFPKLNQLSFPHAEGYENQKLVRHEGDSYRRIVGDTVEELGGTDVPTEEEARFSDNSYLRVYKAGGTKALQNISQGNEDAQSEEGETLLPYKVKKEERKGFYFQHASGTRFLIDPDGRVKVSHHTGTWFTIAPEIADIPLENVKLQTIESKNNPQTPPDNSTTQVHLQHSSGTRITIKQDGSIEIYGVKNVDTLIDGNMDTTVKGNVTTNINGAMQCTVQGQATIKADQINLNP
jgi:hypothetical protein